MQQTLNDTLDNAYLHVFVPMEALSWIRSITIVLLMVAHALHHAHHECAEAKQEAFLASLPAQLMVTHELLDALRPLLAQTTVSENATMPYALPSPWGFFCDLSDLRIRVVPWARELREIRLF